MNIEDQIAGIEILSNEALKLRWRKYFRRSPPAGLPPKMMREAFIYALQENAFGGLSPNSRRRLDRIATKIDENPNATITNESLLQPGSCLVRDWRGKRFEVEVLEKGFSFNGKSYASLSEIARMITGTRWSGPRFFGLKQASRS